MRRRSVQEPISYSVQGKITFPSHIANGVYSYNARKNLEIVMQMQPYSLVEERFLRSLGTRIQTVQSSVFISYDNREKLAKELGTLAEEKMKARPISLLEFFDEMSDIESKYRSNF